MQVLVGLTTMGYQQPTPGQQLGLKIRGIVILCATIIIIGIIIYICFTILGATFSAFDKLTYLLSATPLAIYDNLRNTVVGIFQAYVIMIPLTALSLLVAAVYKLRNPGDEQ